MAFFPKLSTDSPVSPNDNLMDLGLWECESEQANGTTQRLASCQLGLGTWAVASLPVACWIVGHLGESQSLHSRSIHVE